MQKIFGIFTAMLLSTYLMAQEKATEIDVDINKDGGTGFTTAPWMWIVGGALFVLLLVALTRGNSSSRRTTSSSTDTGDRVTVTKTVERDTTTDL
jgi:hypothetical protein